MWPDFLHHLSLHFTIVVPMALAVVGAISLRHPSPGWTGLLRWGGHIALLMATITVATGLLAGGFSGGEEALQHHRYLGVLTFLVIALAALSFEGGLRRQSTDLQQFAIGLWWVASFSVIGAGHWGGVSVHPDVIPF